MKNREDWDNTKKIGLKGSERGVVGKSSMRGKKKQLDKQMNIRRTRQTREKRLTVNTEAFLCKVATKDGKDALCEFTFSLTKK